MFKEKQQFLTHVWPRWAIGLVLLAALALITSCCRGPGCLFGNPAAKPPPPRSPGLYGLNGWNNTKSDTDINGEVGHPLAVDYPRADCVPSGHWSFDQRVSGTFPPGMSLDSSTGGISGLPTERGHWIVKMELYNLLCGGSSYEGFTQTLRFHISGSGKVVN